MQNFHPSISKLLGIDMFKGIGTFRTGRYDPFRSCGFESAQIDLCQILEGIHFTLPVLIMSAAAFILQHDWFYSKVVQYLYRPLGNFYPISFKT